MKTLLKNFFLFLYFYYVLVLLVHAQNKDALKYIYDEPAIFGTVDVNELFKLDFINENYELFLNDSNGESQKEILKKLALTLKEI